MGRQWETMGDKTSGRRTHHPTQAHIQKNNGRKWETMGDNGRPGETRPRKAGTPFKKAKRDIGRRQGETRPWEGGHTIQHKRILWGDNGRQGETRPQEHRGLSSMVLEAMTLLAAWLCTEVFSTTAFFSQALLHDTPVGD